MTGPGPAPTDTPENVARLRELRLTHSNEACGSALGISATTVRRWAAKHGIPACAEPSVLRGRNGREPWPDERVALLRQLRAGGMPYQDIAAVMGLSKSTVCGKAQRIGLAPLAVPLKRRPGVQIGRPAKVKPVSAPVIRAQRPPTGPTLSPAGLSPTRRTPTPTTLPVPARTYARPSTAFDVATFGCPVCARHILGPMVDGLPGWKGLWLWS